MSTIYLMIFVAVIFSANAAVQLRAPPVVYSARITNADDSSVQCYVVWETPKKQLQRGDPFTVQQGNYHVVPENLFEMDDHQWQARGIIQEIHCDNLVLIAPFDHVNSPKTNWEFRVEANQIVSVGPSSSEQP